MTRVFTGLAWTCFSIRLSNFQSIAGAQPNFHCLTVRTIWLLWRVWPPHSLGMWRTAWLRRCDVEQIETCMIKFKLCSLQIHLYTFKCHMTTFCYRSWLPGIFNWPHLPSWIRFFMARWVRAAHARSSRQNTRANIGMFFPAYCLP